uniref:Protein TBATA n=1 Tax=Ciona savignyi TaxID=51511 RepID=H2Z4Q0_CIOSA
MIANVQRPSSSFSVFKPRKKSLLVRGALGDGTQAPRAKKDEKQMKLLSDVPKPIQTMEYPLNDLILPASRAVSRDGSFGSYSQASFFSRHNPHPVRVRHIKGLNGIPICTVNDYGMIPVHRFSISTPTTRERNELFKSHLTSSTLGINSTNFPIDTITGLQNYPFREKAVPRIGLVPITESWRNQLHEFCTNVGLTFPEVPLQEPAPPTPKRESMYSRQTGRLKPVSRQSTYRNYQKPSYNHITSYPDTEFLMLELLCQVLHTDSIPSVQQWLVSAGDREKTLVMEIIKSAISQEEQNLRNAASAPSGEVKNVVSMPEKIPDLVDRDELESRRSSYSRRPHSTRPLGTAQRPLSALQETKEEKLELPPIMRYSKTPNTPLPTVPEE